MLSTYESALGPTPRSPSPIPLCCVTPIGLVLVTRSLTYGMSTPNTYA